MKIWEKVIDGVIKMIFQFKKEEGFTLLETLIAMVILGISISILVEAYLTVTNGIEYQKTYNYVLGWSGDKMTELVNDIELARHGNFKYADKYFQWHVEENLNVRDFIDEELSSGLKKIDLLVEWQDNNGIRNYRISRIILEK